MRQIVTAALLFLSLAGAAQTKKIAFKSHSGSDENFRIALANDLFDMDNSNFGLPPNKEIYTKRLDSVFYISDSVTVVALTHFVTYFSGDNRNPQRLSSTKDTLYHHALFGNKHSLDSIRSVLKSSGEYQYHSENAVFVGYDNKKKKNKKHSELVPVLPSSGADQSTSLQEQPVSEAPVFPLDKQALLMLSLVLVLSLAAGLIAWKYSSNRSKNLLLAGN